MNPVSVSTYGSPCRAAITPSRDEETIEVAKVPLMSGSRRIRWVARSAPTSSPRSSCQPSAGVGTATAQRSASGSFATMRSAPTAVAAANAASIAPGSSGFGNATVGKSGSGSDCVDTTWTSRKPARANAASTIAPPTPCSGV